jgi:nucleotide-binding universal stress UspA family protein
MSLTAVRELDQTRLEDGARATAEHRMRLLLATDGSPAARVAVDLVAGVDWPAGSSIRLVKAVEEGAASFDAAWPGFGVIPSDVIAAEMRETAADDLHRTGDVLARPGLDVVPQVLRGRPAMAIVDAARAMAADLIVLGSAGRSSDGSMRRGSVSSDVIDLAAGPVLIARARHISRVVLAWDGSPCAATAVGLVRRWPIFRRAAIRVLSVAAPDLPWWTGFPTADTAQLATIYGETLERSRSEHDSLAAELAGELMALGFNVSRQVADGDPGSEIIDCASAWDADLIVMGTHGLSGASRLVLGGVVRDVLRRAPCSILVTPAV